MLRGIRSLTAEARSTGHWGRSHCLCVAKLTAREEHFTQHANGFLIRFVGNALCSYFKVFISGRGWGGERGGWKRKEQSGGKICKRSKATTGLQVLMYCFFLSTYFFRVYNVITPTSLGHKAKHRLAACFLPSSQGPCNSR